MKNGFKRDRAALLFLTGQMPSHRPGCLCWRHYLRKGGKEVNNSFSEGLKRITKQKVGFIPSFRLLKITIWWHKEESDSLVWWTSFSWGFSDPDLLSVSSTVWSGAADSTWLWRCFQSLKKVELDYFHQNSELRGVSTLTFWVSLLFVEKSSFSSLFLSASPGGYLVSLKYL